MIEKFWPQIVARARTHPVGIDIVPINQLKEYYKRIGQPGGEQALFAELNAANQQRGEPPPAQPHKIELPRLAEVNEDKRQDLFSLPVLTFPVPLTEPVVQRFLFPKGDTVRGARSLQLHDGTLWVLAITAEKANVESRHDLADKDIAPLVVDRSGLWRMTPGQVAPSRYENLPVTNSINSMTFHSNVLWLALDGGGIASLDVASGALKRFEKSAGVASDDQNSVVATDHGVAAIGGMNDFILFDDPAARWTPFQPALPHQNFILGGPDRRLASR